MAEININIDTEIQIDVEEFLFSCSKNEIIEIIEWLEFNNLIKSK